MRLRRLSAIAARKPSHTAPDLRVGSEALESSASTRLFHQLGRVSSRVFGIRRLVTRRLGCPPRAPEIGYRRVLRLCASPGRHHPCPVAYYQHDRQVRSCSCSLEDPRDRIDVGTVTTSKTAISILESDSPGLTNSATAPRSAASPGRAGLRRPGRRESNPAAQSAALDARSAPSSASADKPASTHDRRDRSAHGAAGNFADAVAPSTIPALPSPAPAPDRASLHARRRGPDRSQLAGAVKLCQHQRITAIRLDPIARFDRDQRRRHHDAIMPVTCQQSMQPITAGARLRSRSSGDVPTYSAAPPASREPRDGSRKPRFGGSRRRGRSRQLRRRPSPCAHPTRRR
jgi:hypothetical protein